MSRLLLEREHELAQLAAAAREAQAGQGSVVLVLGEAGIGKSSLVEAARSVLPAEGRLLVGYCDDLATPRVLGPLRDLVGSVGTTLTRALESGDRGAVIDALRAELDWQHHATVLVVEDVHWADEATLDVLRFLVRRIATVPLVLVLTYRDEEIGRDHPLQPLLALAAGPRLLRLPLTRLSQDAVRRLGAGTGADVGAVYAVTSGNPFFVTEVLASGGVGRVPPTIAAAVQARLAGLDAATRDALDRLAVVPSAVERWLVDEVVPGGLPALAAAEQRGVLVVSPGRITFRHELMRRAIVDAMPAVRRVSANHAVLRAIVDRPGVDLSRVVHHAAQAGDDDVVVARGPVVARQAAAAQSHREAAAHFRLVLEHRAAYSLREQAELLEDYAVELYTLGLAEPAKVAQQEAVGLRRRLGDPLALGLGLRWLSRNSWWAGDRPAAEAAAAEAIAVLELVGDRPALAMALSNQSQLHALAGLSREAVAVGERAVAMARELGDPGLLSHALNNVGFALSDLLDPRGGGLLHESLTVALEAHEIEHACRAYVNLCTHLIDGLELDEATRLLGEGIEMAQEAEFIGFLRYLHMTRGIVHLHRGAWDDAMRDAEWSLDAPLNMRCPALIVQARVLLRTGRDGADALLAEAWAIARRIGEAQRLGPAATALAEAAWLRGERLAPEVAAVHPEVRRLGNPANAAETGARLLLAGADVSVAEVDHPFALLAAGRWREAARRWESAGCRYDQAIALTYSRDVDDVLPALAICEDLGAAPLARRVRARLRELGLSRVPRGPAPATRENPAGLTRRQVEVARLLAEGLSNAEIASRLVLSVRTVDSHVAAVLDKLGTPTRREAAVKVRALGLPGGDRTR
jgi:DNA-binding CsgD family transcriptional regulator/tetratricopeptide (TPR) repeat protein